jgi:mannose-6-phosphate isomerase-like protein (cupin superfamily)
MPSRQDDPAAKTTFVSQSSQPNGQFPCDELQSPPVFDPTSFDCEPISRKIVKPWGWELHWTPAMAPYVGKVLHINATARISLQFHDEKVESWFLLHGRATLLWQDRTGALVETAMQPGIGYSCSVGQLHRIQALTDCEIIEVSTPEIGTTWRIEDDYGRSHETQAVRARDRRE